MHRCTDVADALVFKFSCGGEDAILRSVDTILGIETGPIETIGGTYVRSCRLAGASISLASCVIGQSGQSIAFKATSKIKSRQNSSGNVIRAIPHVPEPCRIWGIDKLLAFPQVFQEFGLWGETMS